MSPAPAYHGRTHVPGGTDPIPGLTLGGGGDMYPNTISLPVLEGVATSNNIECNTGPTWVQDNTYAFAAYLKLGDADGDHISFLCKLGPYGSRWKIQPLIAHGPNAPKVTFSIATAEDATDNPSDFPDGEIEDASQMTFVNQPNMTIDYYRASFEPIRARTTSVFRITGADGAVGTAFTLNGDHHDWDGGAGMHRVKATVDGKNASSGGYQLRMCALMLVRVDEFNQP